MYGTNYYRVIPVYSIEINMKGKHNSFKTTDVNFTTNTVLILGQKEGCTVKYSPLPKGEA